MSMNGTVEYLIIGLEAKKPLHTVASVFAEAGRGLVGDRYYLGVGAFNAKQFDQSVREVSLIMSESIGLCNERLGTELHPIDFRRNVVTKGIDLAGLRGKRFRIGEAVFRAVRTAPPCRYLSRLTGEDMMKGLKNIGGIRAVIEKSGKISVGDTIHVLD